jgi:SnoaL-like domain
VSALVDPGEWQLISQLVARYWARADGLSGESAGDMFVEHGELVLGPLRLEGRAHIERFFIERDATHATQQRITRHFSSPPWVVTASDHRVELRSTVMVFAGCGAWPLPMSLPTGVADFHDVCERDAVHGWRFRSRHATSVFVGEGAAAFARGPAQSETPR